MTWPSLTPTYGFGTSGRTGMSLLVSSPRNKIGSMIRILNWYKQRGEGQQYIQFLIKTTGIEYLPRVNPWNNI